MKEIKLNAPLSEKDVTKLRAGNKVLISGVVYTARDQAHKRFLKQNKLPFNPAGQIIFYAGPTPGKGKHCIGSIGPTTSSRMDEFTPRLLSKGVKGFIGKGERSPEVIKALKQYRGIYFAAFGGVAALQAKFVLKAKVIHYKDLGPEAVYQLKVQNFPAIVAIDTKGNNIFKRK